MEQQKCKGYLVDEENRGAGDGIADGKSGELIGYIALLKSGWRKSTSLNFLDSSEAKSSISANSEASEQALVGHLSRHRGPVRGLEFNAIAPNLLASGADDGEICIWDLAAAAEPSHFPPLKACANRY
ncbi:hypothetical protein REPUB_Repub01dG0213400 [Reevesia pubescens]